MSRILFLEPFFGGSHAAFLNGWEGHSKHEFTVLQLPPQRWKWRMRHASISLAEETHRLHNAGQRWDVIICSDMLNLPEWKGMTGRVADLPSVVYFHENQFSYPLSKGERRDFHYGYTNFLSCAASDNVWFNSEFHKQEFLTAAEAWLRRMPDGRHLDHIDSIRRKSSILYPGFDPPSDLPSRSTSTIARIGWVGRWEHDKRPDRFADALADLAKRGIAFELVLLGEQFEENDSALERIRSEHKSRIIHDEFAKSKRDYWHLLTEMDFVVSTADHEFFGIGIVEAAWAGAIPVLPDRLAYPELFAHNSATDRSLDKEAIFYSEQAQLVSVLQDCCCNSATLRSNRNLRFLERFQWSQAAKTFDNAVDQIITQNQEAE